MKQTFAVAGIALLIFALPAVLPAQDAGTPDEESLKSAHSQRPYSPLCGRSGPKPGILG